MFRLFIFIIAFGFAIQSHAADCGQFKVVKGKVSFKKKSKKKYKKARINKKVCQGDIVKTGSKSRAKIIMADQNEINISPQSELLIEVYQKNKKAVLSVLNGRVRSNVKKKYQDSEASHYRVKTKSAVAGVRGTEFLASYNANTNQSKVVTFEGEVMVGRVEGGKVVGKVSVKPGQFTTNKPGENPKPAQEVPPAELAKMDSETNVSDAPTGDKAPASAAGEDKGGEDSGDEGSQDQQQNEDQGQQQDEGSANQNEEGGQKGEDGKGGADQQGADSQGPDSEGGEASNGDNKGDGGGDKGRGQGGQAAGESPNSDNTGGTAGDGPSPDGVGDAPGGAGPDDSGIAGNNEGGSKGPNNNGPRGPASITPGAAPGADGTAGPAGPGDAIAFLPPPDLDSVPGVGGDVVFEPPPIISPDQILPVVPPGTDCLTCNDAVINQDKVKVIIVPVLPGGN